MRMREFEKDWTLGGNFNMGDYRVRVRDLCVRVTDAARGVLGSI